MVKKLQVISDNRAIAKNPQRYSFQQATVHKDFLLHLFNPTNEDKISHEYFTEYGKIVMYNSANEKSELSKIKPLPNFAEFKLMMSLLYYSQKIKSRGISFNSVSDLLEAIGYAGGNNHTLFDRMIERYFWFRIFFDDSLTFDLKNEDLSDINYDPKHIANKGKFNSGLGKGKIDILESVRVDKISGNSVRIVFTERFWKMCHRKYGWSKTVNLAVIKELKSPRQLQIYLFLCEWMNYQCYAKWSIITIKSFIQETGFHFNENDPSRYTKLMSEIKQALEIIYKIELGCLNQSEQVTAKSQMWNIKIRESIFKKQRKIQFISPLMKHKPGNSNARNTDLMAFSEWKELFPELTTDDWMKCKHTEDNFIENESFEIIDDDDDNYFPSIEKSKSIIPLERKPLPEKFIEEQRNKNKHFLDTFDAL